MSSTLKQITSDGGFITAGNITTGNISATGNATFTSISTSGSDGNISGANVISANIFTATGNIIAGSVITNGSDGNISGANVISANIFTATGNITGANLVTGGNVQTENIVNITANTSIGMGNGSGIVAIYSAGNATQFNPSGQITLGGASQIVGGTFGGSGITVAGTQTDIFQNRGGNVTVQVGTDGNIANTWTFTNSGNLLAPGDISATGNITAGNITTNGSDGNISGANVIAGNTISASSGLTSTGLTNLGAVGNVTITGGSTGQYLQTDGTGVLSWASVSGGGLPLANGNSNVNIATANGNVSITSNGINTWNFDSTGNLTLASGGQLIAGNLSIGSSNGIGVIASIIENNGELNLLSTGDGTTTIGWSGNYPGIGNVASMIFSEVSNTGNAIIRTGNTAGTTYNWNFDNTGNLTLPANTFSINYANGTQVPLGSANTGNVTFSDQIVIGTGDESGTGGLYLATGPTGAANLQYLQVRGGDVSTHIHLDTGNNSFYDQYFGNDYKYVKLSAGDTGNIVIGTDDGAGNSYTWNFDSTGNLTLPTISLGASLNEQTLIQSQRKIIPPNRYSVLITGNTPTLVYTATSGTVSLKTTIVVQSSSGGFEMFDVAAALTSTGAVIYSVSNRLNGTGQPDTTAVVDTNGSGYLAITLTVNTGATTSYVTYDSTEFGIAND